MRIPSRDFEIDKIEREAKRQFEILKTSNPNCTYESVYKDVHNDLVRGRMLELFIDLINIIDWGKMPIELPLKIYEKIDLWDGEIIMELPDDNVKEDMK